MRRTNPKRRHPVIRAAARAAFCLGAAMAWTVPAAAGQVEPASQAYRTVNFSADAVQQRSRYRGARVVDFQGQFAPGSIIVRTAYKRLYYVLPGGRAIEYGIGVGRDGFQWSGITSVSRKAEWPDWRPPAEMRERQPEIPEYMPGGPENPLGARALYLGSTLYRIHGTSEPWTIGTEVSSGCIRMLNEEVIDLYRRVQVGAKVYVL